MAKNTTNYGFVKPELTDAPPDITVMNGNWDIIDEQLKKAVDGTNITPEDIGALPRFCGTLDSNMVILDTLNTVESTGNWSWLAPADNPWGITTGALCVVNNDMIQHGDSIGISQSVKPVYPSGDCGKIFTRSYYYANAGTAINGWTKWNSYLPLDGSVPMTGDLWLKNNMGRLIANNESNQTTVLMDAYKEDGTFARLALIKKDDGTAQLRFQNANNWNFEHDVNIYGEHNITKGTASLTAGTSALPSGGIYLQYE